MFSFSENVNSTLETNGADTANFKWGMVMGDIERGGPDCFGLNLTLENDLRFENRKSLQGFILMSLSILV